MENGGFWFGGKFKLGKILNCAQHNIFKTKFYFDLKILPEIKPKNVSKASWTGLFLIFCKFLPYLKIFQCFHLTLKNHQKCLGFLCKKLRKALLIFPMVFKDPKTRFSGTRDPSLSFYNKCNLITRKSFFYDLVRHQIYVKMHRKKLLIFVWWCSRML